MSLVPEPEGPRGVSHEPLGRAGPRAASEPVCLVTYPPGMNTSCRCAPPPMHRPRAHDPDCTSAPHLHWVLAVPFSPGLHRGTSPDCPSLCVFLSPAASGYGTQNIRLSRDAVKDLIAAASRCSPATTLSSRKLGTWVGWSGGKGQGNCWRGCTARAP